VSVYHVTLADTSEPAQGLILYQVIEKAEVRMRDCKYRGNKSVERNKFNLDNNIINLNSSHATRAKTAK
jgi:hypothetical protein